MSVKEMGGLLGIRKPTVTGSFMIGDTKISEITTRYLEKYYQQLLKTPAVQTVALLSSLAKTMQN